MELREPFPDPPHRHELQRRRLADAQRDQSGLDNDIVEQAGVVELPDKMAAAERRYPSQISLSRRSAFGQVSDMYCSKSGVMSISIRTSVPSPAAISV